MKVIFLSICTQQAILLSYSFFFPSSTLKVWLFAGTQILLCSYQRDSSFFVFFSFQFFCFSLSNLESNFFVNLYSTGYTFVLFVFFFSIINLESCGFLQELKFCFVRTKETLLFCLFFLSFSSSSFVFHYPNLKVRLIITGT